MMIPSFSSTSDYTCALYQMANASLTRTTHSLKGLFERIATIRQHVFCVCYKTQDASQDTHNVADSAKRLLTLYHAKSPTIKEYIAYAQNPANLSQAKIYSRLFLEYIYAKKIGAISKHDTHKMMLHIHPDKQQYREATELFKLHQGFLDMAKPTDHSLCSDPATWIYYTLLGWYYLRHIHLACRQADIEASESPY